VHRGKIPKVAAMATLQDIRVYRMGQALFEVIAKNYGEERVRRILKRPGPGGGPSGRTPRDSLFTPAPEPASLNRNDMATTTDSLAFAPGTPSIESLDKLWHTWADSLATKLGSHLVNPDSVAERITEPGKYRAFVPPGTGRVPGWQPHSLLLVARSAQRALRGGEERRQVGVALV
jgi:hypothetical protein